MTANATFFCCLLKAGKLKIGKYQLKWSITYLFIVSSTQSNNEISTYIFMFLVLQIKAVNVHVKHDP